MEGLNFVEDLHIEVYFLVFRACVLRVFPSISGGIIGVEYVPFLYVRFYCRETRAAFAAANGGAFRRSVSCYVFLYLLCDVYAVFPSTPNTGYFQPVRFCSRAFALGKVVKEGAFFTTTSNGSGWGRASRFPHVGRVFRGFFFFGVRDLVSVVRIAVVRVGRVADLPNGDERWSIDRCRGDGGRPLVRGLGSVV